MIWMPILTICVQVTLIAILGLLFARSLRSAAHRHSVLLAALICIVASPLLYVGTAWIGLSINVASVFPTPSQKQRIGALPSAQNREPQAKADRDSPVITVDSATSGSQGVPASAAEFPAEPVAKAAFQRSATAAIHIRTGWMVAGIWLAGTLFSLLGVVRSLLKTDRILRTARPVDDNIEEDVVTMAEQTLNASARLRIATSGKVAGPVVVGLFESWILIPVRYLETLSRDELLQVLIHEGAHALRRDPIVALFQRIGSTQFWWHPLIHLVNRELTLAREEVCDNFVLTCTEPEEYGATLLKLATLSPAMAQFGLAIGIFDSRGKLESRIEHLIETRRIIMTRVNFVTAATVLVAFGVVSVLLAASRVGAENPPDPPTKTSATQTKEAKAESVTTDETRDAKRLQFFLTYQGASDKPFYDLILSVPPVSQREKPFTLFHQISVEQGEQIMSLLKESRFFEHAAVATTDLASETTQHYVLRVQFGEMSLHESLGWNSKTIARLGALRKSLDGDAAKSMDQLLARLDGMRKVWELRESVAADTTDFENAIDQVVKTLPSDGMWTNGLTPHIDLAADAKPADVIAEAVKKYSAVNDGSPYRVLHLKTVKFAPPTGSVWVALIQNDAGAKVLIFYAFPDSKGWWTRFYESDFAQPKPARQTSVQNHAAFQKTIDQLVVKLAADGLWRNGRFPRIDLAEDAKASEVIADAMRKRDSSVSVQPYRVLHLQEITSEPQFQGASGALIQNKSGVSVLLFSWAGQGRGWNWWNRFYAVEFPAESLEPSAYCDEMIEQAVNRLNSNRRNWELNGRRDAIRLPANAPAKDVIEASLNIANPPFNEIESFQIVSVHTLEKLVAPGANPWSAAVLDTNLGQRILIWGYLNEDAGWWPILFDPAPAPAPSKPIP